MRKIIAIALFMSFDFIWPVFSHAAPQERKTEYKAYSDRKDYNSALKILSQAENKEPDNNEIKLARARVYSWNGEYNKAADILTGYLAKHPDDTDAQFLLGNLRYYENRPNEARDMMQTSAIFSEQEFLHSIWLSSLALCLLSIFVMMILIIRRLIIEKRIRRMLYEKAKIRRILHRLINSDIDYEPHGFVADLHLVTSVSLHTLHNIKGKQAERLIEIIKSWGIFPYLEKLTNSPNKIRRIQALTLLSYFHEDSVSHILLAHIKDKDMYVRLAALRGLARCEAITHIDEIIDSLNYHGHTNTLMLADILERFGEPAIPRLHKILHSEAPADVKSAILIALGNIGSLETVDILRDFLNHKNSEGLKPHVITSLGKLGDNHVSELVMPFLTEENLDVRIESAKSLGNFQVRTAIPQLVEMLGDTNWLVRFYAATSLYKSGNSGIATLKLISGQNDNAGLISKQVLSEMEGVQ